MAWNEIYIQSSGPFSKPLIQRLQRKANNRILLITSQLHIIHCDAHNSILNSINLPELFVERWPIGKTWGAVDFVGWEEPGGSREINNVLSMVSDGKVYNLAWQAPIFML